ncbi:hypothetical protein ABVT39_018493 [Epinephelus coioides]
MLRLLLYLAALSQLTGGQQQQQISTCTVTGPAVIDFSSNVGTVEDHCAYTLVSGAGLQVIGAFKERRRQDVSFLDHVILQVDGASDNVQLNQGGKVQAGDTTLSLSSTPQTENSVELSKDENTVTAKVTLSTHTITVIFDGTTAHIHMIGSPTQTQTGLCVDSSSSQVELKDDDLSSDSCGKQSTESNRNGIECSKMTQHCELLKAAPFTSCSISPDPYFTACKDTLCNYPAVDGLGCQFLEAYVEVCRLQNDATLDDWRSQTGCCDATVCGDNTASVSLAACLLAEKGIHHSDLHLNEQSCGGEFDEDSGMVTFTFKSSKSCGSLITAKENKIFYENTITTDSSTGPISRQNPVEVSFSCFYNQPEDQSMAFTIKGSCGNPDDNTVSVVSNSKGGTVVAFQMFQFKGNNDGINLNFKMKLCLKSNKSCMPSDCGRTEFSLTDPNSLQVVTQTWFYINSPKYECKGMQHLHLLHLLHLPVQQHQQLNGDTPQRSSVSQDIKQISERRGVICVQSDVSELLSVCRRRRTEEDGREERCSTVHLESVQLLEDESSCLNLRLRPTAGETC